MKKVAIYTWCYDIGRTNYGQILQCYATQEIIRHLGFEPLLIKYRKLCKDEDIQHLDVDSRIEYEKNYRIKKIEGELNGRIKGFFDFIENRIISTPPLYSEAEIINATKEVESYLLGSDQLWAPQWFDPVTLFEFVDSTRKISYATSGIEDKTPQGKEACRKIAEGIEGFKDVSVREHYGRKILEKYTDTKIHEVLDPTLLLSKATWNEIASKRETEDSYLLCYFLGKISEKKIVIKSILNKYRISKAVYIKTNYFEEGVVEEGILEEAKDVGPCEFLSLIKNAKAVYTDSYHGSIFSIIYRKQFFVAKYVNPFRITDLCRKLNIADRSVNSIKQLEEVATIDYTWCMREFWYERDKCCYTCL